MRSSVLGVLAAACLLAVGCGEPTRPATPPSAGGPYDPAAAYPSNELLTIHRYLEAKRSSWHLFYDEIGGKRYQWLIWRRVTEDGVHYSFDVGREIDDSGEVIGGECPVSDQFFSLRLDAETAEVLEMYGLGG